MRKVIDQAMLDRMRVLKFRDGLTNKIIGQRLGLAEDWVRVQIKKLREAGLDNYSGVQSAPAMTPTCMYCDDPLVTQADRLAGKHPRD